MRGVHYSQVVYFLNIYLTMNGEKQVKSGQNKRSEDLTYKQNCCVAVNVFVPFIGFKLIYKRLINF